MAEQADLRVALAEALKESKFPTTDDADAASWESWDAEGGAPAPEAADTAPADEDKPGKDEAAVAPEAAEPADSGEAADLPDEYWGVSLEGIPDEAKKSILDHFAQQDSTIQQLQARLTKEPAAPAPVETSDDEEITDEALAIALGYDPQDQYNQPTPRELTMARSVIALEDKVDALVQKDAVSAVEHQWNAQLDELETVQGKLPFDRVQVLRYAIEEGIASPFEVYFRLSAPVKREVEQTVAEARRQVAKKAEAGGVKPRGTAGDTTAIDPKTTSLRDAVAIAMKESEKETGLSFKNIFGRKQFRAEEE